MNVGDLIVHLTMIEESAKAARVLYVDALQAEHQAKRPTLVLAGAGLNTNGHGRLAVPNAQTQALQAAQNMRGMADQHIARIMAVAGALNGALQGTPPPDEEDDGN